MEDCGPAFDCSSGTAGVRRGLLAYDIANGVISNNYVFAGANSTSVIACEIGNDGSEPYTGEFLQFTYNLCYSVGKSGGTSTAFVLDGATGIGGTPGGEPGSVFRVESNLFAVGQGGDTRTVVQENTTSDSSYSVDSCGLLTLDDNDGSTNFLISGQYGTVGSFGAYPSDIAHQGTFDVPSSTFFAGSLNPPYVPMNFQIASGQCSSIGGQGLMTTGNDFFGAMRPGIVANATPGPYQCPFLRHGVRVGRCARPTPLAPKEDACARPPLESSPAFCAPAGA
jgi:hypothetical protein